MSVRLSHWKVFGLSLAASMVLGMTTAAAPAASWSSPVTLSAPVYGRVQIDAGVALDALGNAVAVWSDPIPYPLSTVRASTQAANGPWSTPVTISPAGESGVDVDVALGGDGTAIAIWTGTQGGSFFIEAATLAAGAPEWSAPVVVAGPVATPSSLFDSRIALDGRGNAEAIWWQYDGVHYTIQAASRPAGGLWTAPIAISPTNVDAFLPDLAMNPSGAAVAVWQLSTPPGNANPYVVEAAYKPAGGAWGAAVDISVPTSQTWNPQVAIDGTGRAFATWSRNGVIEMSRRNGRGQWSAPQVLSQAGTSNNYYPAIAVDLAGTPTVAWQSYASFASKIVVFKLGTPRARLSAASEDAGPPRVAASPDGSLIVVGWEDNTGLAARAVTRTPDMTRWPVPVTLGQDGVWNSLVLLHAANGVLARAVWIGRTSIVDQTVMQVSSYGP